jgi:hypothetical protein
MLDIIVGIVLFGGCVVLLFSAEFIGTWFARRD